MINLKEFLESDKTTISGEKQGWGYRTTLAKIFNRTKDVVYILKNEYSKSDDFNPFEIEERSFMGIYYIEKNTFYFKNNLEFEYRNLDLSNLNYYILTEVQKEFVKEVNKKIIEQVNNDETKLGVNIEDVELNDDSYVENNARRIFLKDYEVEIDSYASYGIESMEKDFDTIVNYIKDNKETVEKESSAYIEENKNEIYRIINANKRTLELMKTFEQDEDYIKIRELNKIFGNKDYKTLNIYYKQDDNEMKFKIEARAFLENKASTISSYNIQSPKDRKKFRDTFKDKRGLDYIEPDYIQEITYGKKVLYKKD